MPKLRTRHFNKKEFIEEPGKIGTDFLKNEVTLLNKNGVGFLGEGTESSDRKVYTAPNGVVVTCSAPGYGTNLAHYGIGKLFDSLDTHDDPANNHNMPEWYFLSQSSGNQVLTFDFGVLEAVNINAIKVWPRTRDDASSNYRILTSNDGVTFIEVVPLVTNTHDANTPYGTIREHSGLTITSRYVRFELTQNGLHGVTLGEIQFIGVGNYGNAKRRIEDLSKGTFNSTLGSQKDLRLAPVVESVDWGNLFGVAYDATADTLTKTGTVLAWDSGAFSRQSIVQGEYGYVEFEATRTDKRLMVGLGWGDEDRNYNTIDWAIYLNINAELLIYENGASRGLLGYFAVGDIFKVEHTPDGTINYYQNGTIFYTSTVKTSRYPLWCDTSFYEPSGSVKGVKIAFNNALTGDRLSTVVDISSPSASTTKISWKESIPTHSLDKTPSLYANSYGPYVITVSSQYDTTTYMPWKAFNGSNVNNVDSWITASGAVTGWIDFDFGSSIVINKYALTNRNDATYRGDPKDWVLQGSVDGITYVDLHSVVAEPSWSSNQRREYTFNNTTAYRFYRVNVSAIHAVNANYVSIGEVEFMKSVTASIKVETNLSLDGGTTWLGWQLATNGGAIPGITSTTDLSKARYQTRVTITSDDNEVADLYVSDILTEITTSLGNFSYITTGSNQISTASRSGISKVVAVQTEPLNTFIKYAVSFDKGVTWKSYIGTTPAWKNISLDTIHSEGMTKAQLESITTDIWASVFVKGTLDIAVSLRTTDVNASPSVTSVDVPILTGGQHLNHHVKGKTSPREGVSFVSFKRGTLYYGGNKFYVHKGSELTKHSIGKKDLTDGVHVPSFFRGTMVMKQWLGIKYGVGVELDSSTEVFKPRITPSPWHPAVYNGQKPNSQPLAKK